jgi:hypothetical protein
MGLFLSRRKNGYEHGVGFTLHLDALEWLLHLCAQSYFLLSQKFFFFFFSIG